MTVFTISSDGENIINVPKLHKRLKLLSLCELTFQLIHKYACIRRSKLSPYCCSWNLLIRFIWKLKVIVLQYKFCHFNEFTCRYFMCFSSTQWLSKCLETSLMWYTWINTTTSAVTKVAFSGIAFMFLILLRKYSVSFIYDSLSCITGLRWSSKNFQTFPVGVSHFQITGLPGTYNLLWILGRRYILLRLIVFLYLYLKYWSSFSDIIPPAFKDLNKWLLFSRSSVSISSLNSTLS